MDNDDFDVTAETVVGAGILIGFFIGVLGFAILGWMS